MLLPFSMAFWDTVLSSSNTYLYGRRLIPTIVDDNARQQPDRTCFSIPICHTNLRHGFQEVNWRCVSSTGFCQLMLTAAVRQCCQQNGFLHPEKIWFKSCIQNSDVYGLSRHSNLHCSCGSVSENSAQLYKKTLPARRGFKLTSSQSMKTGHKVRMSTHIQWLNGRKSVLIQTDPIQFSPKQPSWTCEPHKADRMYRSYVYGWLPRFRHPRAMSA